jgi:hypothetical protein
LAETPTWHGARVVITTNVNTLIMPASLRLVLNMVSVAGSRENLRSCAIVSYCSTMYHEKTRALSEKAATMKAHHKSCAEQGEKLLSIVQRTSAKLEWHELDSVIAKGQKTQHELKRLTVEWTAEVQQLLAFALPVVRKPIEMYLVFAHFCSANDIAPPTLCTFWLAYTQALQAADSIAPDPMAALNAALLLISGSLDEGQRQLLHIALWAYVDMNAVEPLPVVNLAATTTTITGRSIDDSEDPMSTVPINDNAHVLPPATAPIPEEHEPPKEDLADVSSPDVPFEIRKFLLAGPEVVEEHSDSTLPALAYCSWLSQV